jgi:hypothetical protein
MFSNVPSVTDKFSQVLCSQVPISAAQLSSVGTVKDGTLEKWLHGFMSSDVELGEV